MGLSLNVRQRRKELGMTQKQLAGMVNVSQPAIAQIETGMIKNPGLEVLSALATALNWTIDEMIREHENGMEQVQP